MSDHDAVSDLFLKISSGVRFGDSGGPVFLGGRVAAVTSFGASRTCSSPDHLAG